MAQCERQEFFEIYQDILGGLQSEYVGRGELLASRVGKTRGFFGAANDG
jgi:hypothetical protein